MSDAAPGALQDLLGQAFAQLSIDRAAKYLVRHDGHIGYRSGGTGLDGLDGLDRFLTPGLFRAGHEADPSRTAQ